jgi:hypothetical protein
VIRSRELVLNRRKKIIKKLQKKDKKANAKLHKSSKPVYVSKAEREKLAEQADSAQFSKEQSINEQTDSVQKDKEQLDSE